MTTVSVGTRVELLANEEEDWPQEFGEVLSVDVMEWGVSIIVRVDDLYLDGDEDDGLREVTEDQLRPVIKS